MAQISFRQARLRPRVPTRERHNVAPCALLVAAASFFFSVGDGATLAGHQVQSGGSLDLQFPLSNYFQEYAAQGGNPRPTTGRVLLFFPNGFDPARSWPILIVTSTTDFGCTSIKDAPWYRDAAMKEGWIVLATDATISPRADSLQWRLSILTATLQMIRNDWPQSAQWPVAFAGFSGGAKRSGILAAMLADNRGFKICGMFLAGINSDRVTAARKDYHPTEADRFPARATGTILWRSRSEKHRGPTQPPLVSRTRKVLASVERIRSCFWLGRYQLSGLIFSPPCDLES